MSEIKRDLDQVREDQLSIGGDIPDVENIPIGDDLSPRVEPEGAAPDDDGEYAFEESDAVLPDDEEEKEIVQDPSREA